VRSDSRGDHQPMSKGVEHAGSVKCALYLLRAQLLDYFTVRKPVTSLR
jgi:hypothetical protein